jgi:glycerophosphoryl diester phosphodiesterase
MQIISHRGYWKNENEKNHPIAFERTFKLGFGTETDIRDFNGELVISHDIANKNSQTLDEVLEIFNNYDKKLPLALNIKADGLQHKLKHALEKHEIENYFVFDMSVPDTINYKKEDIFFYSRQSEYELKPVFYNECKGIWLDAFTDIWYSTKTIREHIANNKEVAIVSPELHKRNMMPLWEQLKKDFVHEMENVILCTDLPEEAIFFFK